MKYRTFSGSDVRVSEVGFGLWTISTRWWGTYTDDEAVAAMRKGLDLGITLFDAADTYGNGRSEGLIAQAFAGRRDEIVIATKVEYDFVQHGDERRGQHKAARTVDSDTMFLIRVPHSSGMLEGKYTAETVFPPNDHRNHRPRSWLLNGVKKVEQSRFLEADGSRTLGQAALLWLLADDRVASVLPNIYDAGQLEEFAAAPDRPALTAEECARVEDLVAANFGQKPEPAKYKGTMEVPGEALA